MTLKEFDNIRPYLPDNTEITINTSPKFEPAITLEFWGNHDGRFNLKCRNCGWRSDDIKAGGRAAMEAAAKEMKCPSCGAKYWIQGDSNIK